MRAASLAETTPFQRADTFGPYLVYEKLGEGGMATVHRAEHVCDSGLKKPVALKRLNTDSSEDPQLVAGFVREAQLAARLRHPNIAQAYDLGRIDDTYYIAMELVPGPTLAQVMTMTRNGAGAVPLSIAIAILIELADALEHVHELRDEGGRPLDLVHRDVSPMNIVISRTGAAKLIDFGIAKVRSARAVTQAGIIKGKHAYIAPEYTEGHLDQRSDLFGLGVVAHELLTGRRLFAAETEMKTINNVREMPVPRPSRLRPGISIELDAIVLRALEREPGMRWQTAGALRNALVAEARRLGIAVSGPQIRDWVEWAFQQVPRRNSSVDRMLAGCEPSISISIELGEPEAVVVTDTAIVDVEEPTAMAATRPVIVEEPTAMSATRPVVIAQTAPEPTRPVAIAAPGATRPVNIVSPPARAATRPVIIEVEEPTTRAKTPPVIVETEEPTTRATPPAIIEIEKLPDLAKTPEPVRTLPVRPTPRSVALALPLPAPPVVAPSIPELPQPRKRRMPAWRPPTRWVTPPQQRSAAPFLLLVLIAFTALAIDQHWIDLERWRQIIDAMV